MLTLSTSGRLGDDAVAIWQAGVEAVRSDRLVQDAVQVRGEQLIVGDQRLPLRDIRRLAVVGCGKAGAGMAAGLEAALGASLMQDKQLTGWINVPDDCVRPLQRIHLHGARPAGMNEPTAAGAGGAERMLALVGSLAADDVCLCLISGGGSALLPAPVAGITLADKLAVTRLLSAAGANIRQLNTVRKQLSRIKGGGLARVCRAGRLISLIISDVLGDPLDVIASGPTVADASTPQQALEILEHFQARQAGISPRVFQTLEQAAASPPPAAAEASCRVINSIIGNLATAVTAAGQEAERRGYRTRTVARQQLEGDAEPIGRLLVVEALAMRAAGGRQCLIDGGEPTVKLVASARRGLGGRNQQLVLAAAEYLADQPPDSARGLLLLSGGTDGEDGPTDAAGAILDETALAAAAARQLSPREYLARNDAYHFFEPLGRLLRTGPTHTNVCDLRVVLTEAEGAAAGR
jgi:glycerate 2-kinase